MEKRKRCKKRKHNTKRAERFVSLKKYIYCCFSKKNKKNQFSSKYLKKYACSPCKKKKGFGVGAAEDKKKIKEKEF